MADEVIKCKDCPAEFSFTERDQAFYAQQGFVKPKRCKPCRDKRKGQQSQPVQDEYYTGAYSEEPTHDAGSNFRGGGRSSRRQR